MLGRLHHMLIKEFIQVLRDRRTRFLLFAPAIIQMLIFGYAATLEIKHVPTVILDYDNTQVTRDLISRFAASQYFKVRRLSTDRRGDVKLLIDRGDAIIALQIDDGFTRDLAKGRTAHLQGDRRQQQL